MTGRFTPTRYLGSCGDTCQPFLTWCPARSVIMPIPVSSVQPQQKLMNVTFTGKQCAVVRGVDVCHCHRHNVPATRTPLAAHTTQDTTARSKPETYLAPTPAFQSSLHCDSESVRIHSHASANQTQRCVVAFSETVHAWRKRLNWRHAREAWNKTTDIETVGKTVEEKAQRERQEHEEPPSIQVQIGPSSHESAIHPRCIALTVCRPTKRSARRGRRCGTTSSATVRISYF